MNTYNICFYMHIILYFCHLYVWQKKSHGNGYWADHLIMQASRACFVDIDQALHRLLIPFGARMALEWNNWSNLGICISILMVFWYKNHICKIISMYNTLILFWIIQIPWQIKNLPIPSVTLKILPFWIIQIPITNQKISNPELVFLIKYIDIHISCTANCTNINYFNTILQNILSVLYVYCWCIHWIRLAWSVIVQESEPTHPLIHSGNHP